MFNVTVCVNYNSGGTVFTLPIVTAEFMRGIYTFAKLIDPADFVVTSDFEPLTSLFDDVVVAECGLYRDGFVFQLVGHL